MKTSEVIRNLQWQGMTGSGSGRISMRMPVERVGQAPRVERMQLQPAQNRDDLIPQEGDYVRFRFRAISQRYLGESGYFLDFSRPGVLQNSIPLMLIPSRGGSRRVPLKFHRNHSRAVQDVIGWVDAAEWNEDPGEGQSAPGINIEVPIDLMLAPLEIRRLLSNPPLVDSVSISFYGNFEKSHRDMDDWKFIEMLGRNVDGEIVRIIVTEITDYDHVGLVYEGADEEADVLTSGRVGLQQSRGDEMELKLDAKTVSALCLALGVDGITNPQELVESVQALAEANAELLKENTTLHVRANAYQTLLATKRDSLKSLIAKVDNSSAMLRIVDLADFETLLELETEYGAKLEDKFPMKCQHCGSASLERRSSIEVQPKQEPAAGDRAVNINPANFRA